MYNFGPVEFAVFNKYINRDSIVYDIGSFTGQYTELFNKLSKQVVAFEPSLNNYNKFIENTKHLDNVKCFQVALHEKEYECDTRFRDCNDSMDEYQHIKYVVLEKFVKENNLPLANFVKHDCETAESINFKTFDFLFENRTIFFLEWHQPPSRDFIQPQVYSDCPGWAYKEDNGYDWNDIKKWNYYMISVIGSQVTILSELSDYNDNPTVEGFLIIPKEKWRGL